MREIKFRAWDLVESRMRYENDVDGVKEWPSILAVGFHGMPISIDNDSFKEDGIIGWNRDHNLILMQFTGLKDKNGKEIYEGDILQYDSPSLKHQYKHQVIFNDGSYKFSGMDSFVFSEMNLNYKRGYKVIGNIYENPELLEEGK